MSSSSVEKIKDRLSIIDVTSSYITLIPAGKNYKAKCPFHNEKTPSFFISPERDSYYCFGCGAKGDIFSFVEQFEGTDFIGALKLLAEKAGVALDNNFSNEPKGEKDKLYKIMEEATLFFEKIFAQEFKPRTYLKNRGILDKTMEDFRIGYAPDSWRSVSVYLMEKGFSKEDLEKVGLIKIKDKNNFYDRFRSRIIFPINDSSGRVIAFSGRIFLEEVSFDSKISSIVSAKYLNSPETPLFNKSNTLFGIDKAKLSIKNRDYSILVEGQLDLILSHQSGFTNTVAVSGTALSDRTNKRDFSSLNQETKKVNNESKINNFGLIRRLSPNIIFAFDGDSAGIRAVNRSSMIALSLDMQVKVALMPEGQDPADIILRDINEWKEIIKNSINIIGFHLNHICLNASDLRQCGKQIREVIFPFLLIIKSSIERSTYISLIHKKTGISENAIIEDFENYEKTKDSENNFKGEISKRQEIKTRRDRLEEHLLGVIFWQSNKTSKLSTEIKKVCSSFEKKIGQENFDKIKEKYKPNSSVLAFEAEIWYGDKIDEIVRDVQEITLNLEEEILNEKLSYLLNQISQKENQGSKEEVSSLLKNYQKIVERIGDIKSYRTQ